LSEALNSLWIDIEACCITGNWNIGCSGERRERRYTRRDDKTAPVAAEPTKQSNPWN
jgi:hypothetical protein